MQIDLIKAPTEADWALVKDCINGEYICEDCLDMHFRKAVEDIVE